MDYHSAYAPGLPSSYAQLNQEAGHHPSCGYGAGADCGCGYLHEQAAERCRPLFRQLQLSSGATMAEFKEHCLRAMPKDEPPEGAPAYLWTDAALKVMGYSLDTYYPSLPLT